MSESNDTCVLLQRLIAPDGKVLATWHDNYVLQNWWERRRWQRVDQNFEQLTLFDHVGQEWKFTGALLIRVRAIFSSALLVHGSSRWYALDDCTCCWPTSRYSGVIPRVANPSLVEDFFRQLREAVSGLSGVSEYPADSIFTFKFGPTELEKGGDSA